MDHSWFRSLKPNFLDTFDENLMAEFKENVTYNNEDMEEIADWYQKSNEYYSNRIDNARRYLIALIQQMTVDDNAGNFPNLLEIITNPVMQY